jgi:glycosyltransferase involved in cell wall biosynthesis
VNRRRVLVLAYFFPPLGGAGVQRTLKFVRYLEPLGWVATVVSTKSRHYPARDPSLLKEIPASAEVLRTRALPLANWLSLPPYYLGLKRMAAFLNWPDGGIGWMPFALATALRAARRNRPDVVYSTSAPYGSHLVALLVARLTGLPWVADFRDEWSANPHLADQPRALAWLSERAERAITREANGVVVAAGYFQLRGLADDDPRRVEIANGVDEDDFPTRVEAAPRRDRFVLSHVGTLYDLQDPSPALRALATLGERDAVDVGRVEVRLVGNVWIPDFSPPPGLRVERTGYVDHARAIAEMYAATVLLLYVPTSSLAPSGKLFEYLASGRPILCLTGPENLASRLVREWDAGVVADPHDEAAIEQALLTLWQRWLEDGLPDQEDVRRKTLERYSRRRTAEQLARVLDEAASD